MKIIHLSDFHLESEDPSYKKDHFIDALISDLKHVADSSTIIAFTGDLLDKGAIGFKHPERAFDFFYEYFLSRLVGELSVKKEQVLIVPGNHDIFRNKADELVEEGLDHKLSNEEEVSKFVNANREKSTRLAKLEDYNSFEKKFYESVRNREISNFDSSFRIQLGDIEIGAACFNTVWRTFKGNGDSLLLGEAQVENALKFIKDCSIKIALMHCPLTDLADFDREVVEPILQREFDILLTGHRHVTDGVMIQGFFGTLLQLSTPATKADRQPDRRYSNGYSLIEYTPFERVSVKYQRYNDDKRSFVPNTDAGNKDGTLVLDWPKTEFTEKKKTLTDLIKRLKAAHFDELNEHLITYGTDTKSPTNVDKLFVEPTLSNLPEGQVAQKTVTNYSVTDLLELQKNFLIYGQKESGKTILLDKLFMEFINRFDQFGKLPVLIEFLSIGNREFATLLRSFLGTTMDQLKEYLAEGKIVLLIDNLSFSQDHKHTLSRLINFVQLTPSARIIATSVLYGEATFPTEYLEFNNTLKFDVAFIQQLNSREIRKMIGNWFTGRPVDLKEKLESVISSFFKLGLPRTPLAVTLFLWIIERQEKKPINNSTLIEIFVENLLEKANFENIYAETFDFKNKQRLLAFFAKFMLDTGDPLQSYQVKQTDAVAFVSEYLHGRVEADAQKLLVNFCRRGILVVQDEEFIRFKLSFFFHYFLAKMMEYHPAFREFVLTDNNFLNFVDEIDIHTGLKRDDREMLGFAQERLVDAFGELNQVLQSGDIDNFFDARDMLSARIDLNEIKSKPTEKDYDNLYDQQLQNLPVKKEIAKKDFHLNPKSYDRILKLACVVLKNSEDVDDFEEKKTAYKIVLVSSISFLIMNKVYLIEYLKKFKHKPDYIPSNFEFNLFVRFLPMIHQILLFDWLGSAKLIPVIKDKVERDAGDNEATELEKFLSIFLLGDLRARKYAEVLQKYVKNVKLKYIKDISFFKVLTYYFFRSNNPDTDDIFLKILAEIKESTKQLKSSQKSRFVKKLADEKKRQGKH